MQVPRDWFDGVGCCGRSGDAPRVLVYGAVLDSGIWGSCSRFSRFHSVCNSGYMYRVTSRYGIRLRTCAVQEVLRIPADEVAQGFSHSQDCEVKLHH